jgi:nicotinic acid mononucleotide adenylyltransferase
LATRPTFPRCLRALLVLLVGALLPASALGRPALIVYPGSFDPITNAHVTEVRRAVGALRLESGGPVTALVVPNHDRPTHLTTKAHGHYVFDKKQREQMARAAFARYDDEAAVRRAFPDGTQTADQLAAIAKRYGRTHDLYLLLGEDAYLHLPEWPRFASVTRRFNLIVSTVPERVHAVQPPSKLLGGVGRSYVARGGGAFVEERTGRTVRVLPLEVPGIRSREVVLRAMTGQKVDHLVPSPVAKLLGSARFRRTLAAATRDQQGEVAVYRSARRPGVYFKFMDAKDASELVPGQHVTPRLTRRRLGMAPTENSPRTDKFARVERVLERARRRNTPAAPSRLDSVFATDDPSAWASYAEGGRVLVRLESISADSVARVDHRYYVEVCERMRRFALAKSFSEKRRLVRQANAFARRYWSSSTKPPVKGGHYEALLGGGARFLGPAPSPKR